MDHSPYTRFQFAHLAPRYWTSWLTLGLFKLIACLPVPVALALGTGIGHLLYIAVPSRRRIAGVNLRLCFPELSEQARKKLVRAVIVSIGKSIAETAIGLWGKPEKSLSRCATIRGVEHVEKVFAEGRGVLFIGGHFMTMDMCARRLAASVPFDMLYRDQPNPIFFHRVLAARESFAGITIDRRDTKKMIRRLRQGKAVWYAPDQDYGPKHSVFAPFFGIPAATITGTARIAEMGRAAVVPLFHYRDDNNQYHIEIGEPLVDYPSGDELIDATRINQLIEDSIRRRPEQYLWVHRRFKTRPEGEPPLYPKRQRRR